MKQEQIHDALNLLDDDMIEAVAVLRASSVVDDKRKQKVRWIKYMSAVACLCVVILGMSVWINDKPDDGVNRPHNGMGMSDGEKMSEAETPGTVTDGNTDGITNENTDGNMDGLEVPSVLVKIEMWQENGFNGVVAGIVDTDIFKEDTKIQVIFMEDISVGILYEDGIKFEKRIPDKADFPTGSIVHVQFAKFEKISDNSNDANDNRCIIYVEEITLADVTDK